MSLCTMWQRCLTLYSCVLSSDDWLGVLVLGWCYVYGFDFLFCACFFFFFFSSRRRHTRSLCDLSSDVCSSDLVIEPLLIDEDYFARCVGREIISNLSKAAGLPTMIATMRPDIDHVDEYVRNTTARAFSVVASALGIPALLPFLRAVCRSKKSWQARHTGVKIVQQIPILMGCAVLPHLKGLVDCIG